MIYKRYLHVSQCLFAPAVDAVRMCRTALFFSVLFFLRTVTVVAALLFFPNLIFFLLLVVLFFKIVVAVVTNVVRSTFLAVNKSRVV